MYVSFFSLFCITGRICNFLFLLPYLNVNWYFIFSSVYRVYIVDLSCVKLFAQWHFDWLYGLVCLFAWKRTDLRFYVCTTKPIGVIFVGVFVVIRIILRQKNKEIRSVVVWFAKRRLTIYRKNRNNKPIEQSLIFPRYLSSCIYWIIQSGKQIIRKESSILQSICGWMMISAPTTTIICLQWI